MLWSRFARPEWSVDVISKAFWYRWIAISRSVIALVLWYLSRYSISRTSSRSARPEWFVDVISRASWKTLNDYFEICHCFYFSISFSIFSFKILRLICLICWYVNKWPSNYSKTSIEAIHIDNITGLNWILCYNLCHRMRNYIIKRRKKISASWRLLLWFNVSHKRRHSCIRFSKEINRDDKIVTNRRESIIEGFMFSLNGQNCDSIWGAAN